MRRTQLYLDDHPWDALHTYAHNQNTTISELVREAVRERYLGNRDQQAKAMQGFVGIRRQSSPRLTAIDSVRALRGGNRLDRLHQR